MSLLRSIALNPGAIPFGFFCIKASNGIMFFLTPFPAHLGRLKKPVERLTPQIWAELKEKTLDELA